MILSTLEGEAVHSRSGSRLVLLVPHSACHECSQQPSRRSDSPINMRRERLSRFSHSLPLPSQAGYHTIAALFCLILPYRSVRK